MRILLKTMPMSTNSLYAHTGRNRFMTVKGRDNKVSIAWEARMQYAGDPITGPVGLKITLWWGDARKHDIDNIKVLLDAMTGILWEDDSQVHRLEITKGIDRGNPRVELECNAL